MQGTNVFPDPNVPDQVNWNLKDTNTYTVRSAWQVIRDSKPPFPWYKVIWFKHHTPRCAFIQRLAVLTRLSTKDLLLVEGRWILNVVSVLDKKNPIPYSHLFFSCVFRSKSGTQFYNVMGSVVVQLSSGLWLGLNKFGAVALWCILFLSCLWQLPSTSCGGRGTVDFFNYSAEIFLLDRGLLSFVDVLLAPGKGLNLPVRIYAFLPLVEFTRGFVTPNCIGDCSFFWLKLVVPACTKG